MINPKPFLKSLVNKPVSFFFSLRDKENNAIKILHQRIMFQLTLFIPI